ncbi:unnamed protein product [Victoria cruziana]
MLSSRVPDASSLCMPARPPADASSPTPSDGRLWDNSDGASSLIGCIGGRVVDTVIVIFHLVLRRIISGSASTRSLLREMVVHAKVGSSSRSRRRTNTSLSTRAIRSLIMS